MLKLCWLMVTSWLAGVIIGYNFEREPSKDHSNKVWSQMAKRFHRRRYFNIFPIGSYVKTMSAVLVGWRGHRIQS